MNNNTVMNFDFNNNSVRIINFNDEILFVASDVAKGLGYDQPHKAIGLHCKRIKIFSDISKLLINIDGISNTVDQKAKLIPESDVYRLVMRSKLESAEKFQDWVMEEVLPSIRKTGKYTIEQTTLPTSYLDALKALVVSEEQKLLLETKVKEDAPKVGFAEAVNETDLLMTVGNFAKMIGLTQNKFFKQLRYDKYLGYSGSFYNKPITKSLSTNTREALIVLKEYISDNGVRYQPYITGVGQLYFQKKYGK